MTDWDAELKKIDKQLESMSDSALIPAPANTAPPAAKAAVATERAAVKTWPALLRLTLATLAAVAILFWPYPSRCGMGLAGYLAAVSGVTIAGVWSAVWTWRHRTARAHILSLLLVLYAMVLAAMEVLPRAGYAQADKARPSFSCMTPSPDTPPPAGATP